MTCGNGTKFRIRECTEQCKDKSIEIQYKPCHLGCCPGRLGNYNSMLFTWLINNNIMLEVDVWSNI